MKKLLFIGLAVLALSAGTFAADINGESLLTPQQEIAQDAFTQAHAKKMELAQVINSERPGTIDTNKLNVTLAAPASGGKEFGGYELTLGGGGVSVAGNNSFGLDVSLSSNPFKQLPSLWLGVAQGVAWEPTFSGSTDLFADWSTHLYKDLWVNTGWSVGGVYDKSNLVWRTGPEVTFQYYIGDSAFLYSGVNYDLQTQGKSGFRYSFGIGLSF